MLQKYGHMLRKLQHTHCNPEPMQYGAKQQLTTIDKTALLNAAEIKLNQQILGSLICYVRIIDLTINTTVNDLAIESTKATKTTKEKMDTLTISTPRIPNPNVQPTKSLPLRHFAIYILGLGIWSPHLALSLTLRGRVMVMWY